MNQMKLNVPELESLSLKIRQDIIDGTGYTVIQAEQVKSLLAKYPIAAFDLEIDLGDSFHD